MGIDLDEGCKEVYAQAVGAEGGFAVRGDSADAAADYPLWVADRSDLKLSETVDMLFIDTSHTYGDTVRELAAWGPLMSDRAAIVLHDTNMPASLSYHVKDGSTGQSWDNDRGVIRAVAEFVGAQWDETGWYDSGALPLRSGWRVSHDPTSCGLTILTRGT